MRLTAAVVAGTVTALAVSMAGTASARLIERGTFHEDVNQRVTRFCDVPGFTVHLDAAIDGRFMIGSHGRDQLAYYHEHSTITEVVTNVANGEHVTRVEKVLDKDHRVTDNGDGTLTIVVLATGNSVLYDSSGTAIARNPGQVRFKILVDDGGTPGDPFDDEFLDFLGFVKGSTGRSDDFCAATQAAIG